MKKIIFTTFLLTLFIISFYTLNTSARYADEQLTIIGDSVSKYGETATLKMNVTVRNESTIVSSNGYVTATNNVSNVDIFTDDLYKTSQSNLTYVQYLAAVRFRKAGVYTSSYALEVYYEV